MEDQVAVQFILDIALSHAKESSASRITGIHLLIGELSSMSEESLHRCWDVLASGTSAEGAKLHFRHVPAELQCMVCFEKYHPKQGQLICPNCGSVGAKIISGEEFSLETVDTE